MFQPAGVVVVFQHLHLVGEAESRAHLHPVVRLILPVPAGGSGLAVTGGSDVVQTHRLVHIVLNALFVAEFGGLLFRSGLIHEDQVKTRVDHRLPLHGIGEIFGGHVYIGEHLSVRLPADDTAGTAALKGLLNHLAGGFTLLEIQMIVEAVPVNIGGHPFAGILGGTQAQAVQTQRILVVILTGGVFAAGIHLAEHQLPVIALLLGVIVHRDTPAKVLHLNASVRKAGEQDLFAVAFAGLVDGVGKDLEDGMGTALHAVRAKDNGRAFAHPVRALQAGNTVVAIFLFFGQPVLPPVGFGGAWPPYSPSVCAGGRPSRTGDFLTFLIAYHII